MSRSNGILSPVQTNFNENPIPAKLNLNPKRYMADITLFCYILGTPVNSAIPVDIGKVTKIDNVDVPIKNLTFGHIKKLIWPNNDKASELRLWRVEISREEKKEKLDTLNKNFRENVDMTDVLGEELDTTDRFPDDYDPPPKTIHIIVQPPFSAGHTDVSRVIANLGYLPRQGGLGGTLIPFDLKLRPSNEGILLNDPDISLRFDIMPSLIRDLMEKRIILVRAPPFSGKTAISQILENNLVQSPEYSSYRVIRVSMIWGMHAGIENCYESFGELWKEMFGIGWSEWIAQCRRVKTVLIIDEAQLIYKEDRKIDEKDKKTANQFWTIVKGCLQEIPNTFIIMFAAYGYKSSNCVGLSTPAILPPANCKSLVDINFTPDELKKYVVRFCGRYLKKLNESDISEFYEYIQKVTEGHVGLARHTLFRTEEYMRKWTYQNNQNQVTFQKIFAYLNSQSFNTSIIENCRAIPIVKSSSNEQDDEKKKKLKLLWELCDLVYSNGTYPLNDRDKNAQYLVKTGVLVVVDSHLHFAAPLISRSFFLQYYGSEERAKTAPSSLYKFIVKIFRAMCEQSGEILRENLGFGTDGNLLEQTWQKEFYRIGTQVLGWQYFLSCDVGAVFGCEGFVDFYVDKLDWAIELLRDGKDMAEHNRRFGHTGEYKEIVKYAENIAIIDIRSESKKVRNIKKNFIYVSYSKDYEKFKIESLGEETVNISFQS